MMYSGLTGKRGILIVSNNSYEDSLRPSRPSPNIVKVCASHIPTSFTVLYLLSEVSVAMGEFAQNVSDLASSDIDKQLAQSLSGLADVERISQDIHSIQAEQDITTLMSTGSLHTLYLLSLSSYYVQ